MDQADYDALKLENQLCFPLYACAKELVRRYTPYLDGLDLTYTQYLLMLVLWERGEQTVKGLGEALFLDSGTLTPVVKKLEAKGYVTRTRSSQDERSVIISLTPQGRALRERAVEIPRQMGECLCLTREEAGALYALLYKILNAWND